MTEDVQRDLGRHEVQIESLQADVSAMRKDLHEMKEMFAELRGGKKAVGILVSAAAMMGGLVSWFASLVMHRPDGVP